MAQVKKCTICQATTELEWCKPCRKWFCDKCKRDLKARTKAAMNEMFTRAAKAMGLPTKGS